MYDWDELNSLIQSANLCMILATSDFLTASWHLGMAGDEIEAEDWSGANTYFQQAKNYLANAANHLGTGIDCFTIYNRNVGNYINDNWPGAVTWKAIAEAWVKDDFEGRVWTIGIIDRMRQIMWDEPFNLTWAARPEDTKGEL